MAESEEELKNFLMKAKKESEKTVLKLNSQKTKIMASGPITSWHKNGETMKDFIFLGSKATMDDDFNHETKTFAPCKKSDHKLKQYIKKQRHHFANKGTYNQSYGYCSSHVWM